jgi:mediator of RNA polymerase II transcription subunit 23
MQDLLSKAISNLSFFIWMHELLPLDILLLALIDRDDDPYALRLVVKPLENSQVSLPISRIMLNEPYH